MYLYVHLNSLLCMRRDIFLMCLLNLQQFIDVLNLSSTLIYSFFLLTLLFLVFVLLSCFALARLCYHTYNETL